MRSFLLCLLSALVLLVHGDQFNTGVNCSIAKAEYLKARKESFFTFLGLSVGLFVIMVTGAILVLVPICRSKQEVSVDQQPDRE